MEVVQTITLTEEERKTIADAFRVMDDMSDAVKDISVYDICSWFCRNIDYEIGLYKVPKCININDL